MSVHRRCLFLHRIVSILIYNEVKKRAESAGQTVSDYMLGVVEDMLDGDKDLILLLRNTYEEVLKLGDMLSLMMGYNTEAYTTMLSRISVNLSEAQLKASKERRESVSKGLRKYLRETNERLNNGENVWAGDSYSTTSTSQE